MVITRNTEKADASDSYRVDNQRKARLTDHAVAEGYADPAPEHPRGPVIDGIPLDVRERYPDKILHECPAFPNAQGVALAPGVSCDACEHRAPTDTAVGKWVVATVGCWHKIVAVDEVVGHTACELTLGDDEVGDTRRESQPDAGACSGCLQAVATAETGDPRAESDGGIVPEGVDLDTLEQRKRAPTTTDRDEIPRCPECERQYLLSTSGGDRGGESDYDYRCDKCGHRCDADEVELGVAAEKERYVRTDGGRPKAYLGADLHHCDICELVTDSLELLGEHPCGPDWMSFRATNRGEHA